MPSSGASVHPANEPDQPAKWPFKQDLKAPLHVQKIRWRRTTPTAREASLAAGFRLDIQFPDRRKLLETAYADFDRFRDSAGIPKNGPYPLRIRQEKLGTPESCRISVSRDRCEVCAEDTEGLRRALVHLEDEMLRRGGPFLPLGITHRKPVIRTRISRCFYGPINRPPKNRDELADAENYYPDEYLNRLAHDGVNGLWLTIAFRDTVPSKIIPEYGRDAARRLEKLRLTVQRCGRYGIKIYPFCIEPAAFEPGSPILERHPQLGGHTTSLGAAFCPSTKSGRAYLEEATHTLFSEVPGLGGLIVIPVGERFTHCCSAEALGKRNNCPRCSRKDGWQVLESVLSAFERGMHSVAPEAELISWPYSQYLCWGRDLTRDAAGHVPKHVILQHNFESYGRNKQLGKWRRADDYWLSYVGPSDLFRDCARRAVRSGRRMFAKLQVGCSHEVATAPCVPTPGILYEKYRKMHRLGVSGAMQCWFFGNFPSIMTRAAGELSFGPLPRTKSEFLLSLARRDWGEDAKAVALAWRHLEDGYRTYPTSSIFGYYGPMHDGPVWPLHLRPRNLPLAPTWRLGYPPSGDRIGEAFVSHHTLGEVLTLCRRMSSHWNKGAEIMRALLPKYRNSADRVRDIRTALALDLQFRSGLNILTFYSLRERMIPQKGLGRLDLLDRMKEIVRDELGIDRDLLNLARRDSALGFHSEAEGYKYFPARIQWRMRQLRALLRTEFPEVRREIQRGKRLFPGYTGERPEGAVYACRRVSRSPAMEGRPVGAPWDNLEDARCGHWSKGAQSGGATRWKAGYDRRAIYISVQCEEPHMGLVQAEMARRTKHEAYWFPQVLLRFEPKRLWPGYLFAVAPSGSRLYRDFVGSADSRWDAAVAVDQDSWSATFRIPWVSLGLKKMSKRPLRFSLIRVTYSPGGERLQNSWVEPHPWRFRGTYGVDNPATDLGWLTFRK